MNLFNYFLNQNQPQYQTSVLNTSTFDNFALSNMSDQQVIEQQSLLPSESIPAHRGTHNKHLMRTMLQDNIHKLKKLADWTTFSLSAIVEPLPHEEALKITNWRQATDTRVNVLLENKI